SANPRTMDIALTEGPNKGKTWPVLYALEGDTLRICGGEVGKGRPAGFETKGNPGSGLLTLRREGGRLGGRAMHIRDIFQEHRPAFSFEFSPPKTDKASGELFATIARLQELRPSFVSVTYGAGGSTRERTHDLVVRIHRETSLTAVSPLTCVCHSRDELGA